MRNDVFCGWHREILSARDIIKRKKMAERRRLNKRNPSILTSGSLVQIWKEAVVEPVACAKMRIIFHNSIGQMKINLGVNVSLRKNNLWSRFFWRLTKFLFNYLFGLIAQLTWKALVPPMLHLCSNPAHIRKLLQKIGRNFWGKSKVSGAGTDAFLPLIVYIHQFYDGLVLRVSLGFLTQMVHFLITGYTFQ